MSCSLSEMSIISSSQKNVLQAQTTYSVSRYSLYLQWYRCAHFYCTHLFGCYIVHLLQISNAHYSSTFNHEKVNTHSIYILTNASLCFLMKSSGEEAQGGRMTSPNTFPVCNRPRSNSASTTYAH